MSDSQSNCVTEEKPEYRDIAGFPGYRVGDDGSVWSSRCKGGGAGTGQWNKLSPSTDTNGYKFVRLSGKSFSVHRLVLEAFVGQRPTGKQCAHDNGIRSDNRLTNLAWKTPKDNASDRLRHGTHPIGSESPLASIDESKAIAIVDLLKNSGLSQREIAESVGTTRHVVSGIATGGNWSRVTGGKVTRKPAMPVGEKNKSHKLTVEQVVKLRELAATGKSFDSLGEMFGIAGVNAYHIARGYSWKHAGGPILVGPRKRGRPIRR